MDESAVYLASRPVPPLAAGEMHLADTSVTLPATLPDAGTYYILVVADGDNALVETLETNNVNYWAIRLSPDLAVSVTAPATALAGSTISVTDTTGNQGLSPIRDTVTAFYLSTTTTVNGSATLLGSRAVPGLDPGVASTEATTLTIPAGVGTAGTYYIVAVADSGGRFAELNETNNTGYAAVKIGPDLHISGLTGPADAAAGATITVTETTRNRGTAPSVGSTTRFYFSTRSVMDASADYLGSRPDPPLAAGETHAAATVVTLPATVPDTGTHYILIVADGDDAIVETLETNNLNVWPLRVSPDLTVGVTAPATALAGATITVTDTTTNEGLSPIGETVTSFYFSTTSTVNGSATFLGSRIVTPLDRGVASTVTTTLTIPATAGAAGTYYIVAVADSGSRFAETNETNNSGFAAIKIGPDLAIAGLTVPANGVAGTTIDVTETSRNRGGAPSAASVTRFYLSTRSTVDSLAVYIGSRPVPPLGPAEEHVATTSLLIPANIGEAGYYYLLAVADGEGTVVETLESNNVRSVRFKIGGDLVVDSLAAPLSAPSGSAVEVIDTVRNRGGAPTAPTTLRFYLSTLKVVDAIRAIPIGSRDVPSLVAGGTDSSTTPVTLPAVAPGTYYIIAVADGAHVSTETNEDNNSRAWRIIVE
jgi:subtilase family serine protease